MVLGWYWFILGEIWLFGKFNLFLSWSLRIFNVGVLLFGGIFS